MPDLAYTPKTNARNRTPGTNCNELRTYLLLLSPGNVHLRLVTGHSRRQYWTSRKAYAVSVPEIA
eukprot:1466619-Rhodomonas_salina.2